MTLNELIQELEDLRSNYDAGEASVEIPLNLAFHSVTSVTYDDTDNSVTIEAL